MMKKELGLHYYFSVVLEIVGIVICCVGLYEIASCGTFNPACFFITAGSLVMATGSLYHAKFKDVFY